MKPVLLILSLAMLISFKKYQSDTWTVQHNKKTLIRTSEESEEKNVKKILMTELDKIGDLVVDYEEGNPNNEWKRTIAIVDENGNSLFEKAEINKIQVSNAELKKLLAGKIKVKIYTWALPKDPAKAALVRIRRVHLCTVVFVH